MGLGFPPSRPQIGGEVMSYRHRLGRWGSQQDLVISLLDAVRDALHSLGKRRGDKKRQSSSRQRDLTFYAVRRLKEQS